MDKSPQNNQFREEELISNVRERFIYLIRLLVINHYGRYKYMEERYGISARKWQSMCNRAQFPTIPMLSEFLIQYPQYASWLLTGAASDGSGQQTDPTKQGAMNSTALGVIDPTQPGWEEKYDQAEKLVYEDLNKRYEKLNTGQSRSDF